jgi:hypothetical protein
MADQQGAGSRERNTEQHWISMRNGIAFDESDEIVLHFSPTSPRSTYVPLNCAFVIALTVNTPGGSPVRESRPPGSVRGALSNERPYRDMLRRRPNQYNKS